MATVIPHLDLAVKPSSQTVWMTAKLSGLQP